VEKCSIIGNVFKFPILQLNLDYFVDTCGKVWVKCGKQQKPCGNSGESMG
jgi:hypothetical protein